MANELVLIIDDNAVNLKLARVVLENASYAVITAASAAAALEVLATARPRLILMDIQLPDMDGLTLTRRLREHPVHGEVPIIALTAYAMKGDRAKAIAAGCNEYVTKPINIDALVATVAAHLKPA